MRANRSSKRPSPTEADDWHAAMGSLLLKAAKASDPLERMLSVTRALFCLLTDILRPGNGFLATPVVILGQHYLSSRQLSERYRGDACKVFLQELCVYDPKDAPTQHKKLEDPTHIDVARMYLKIKPVSRAKVKKDGIISTASSPYLELSFEGESSVLLYKYGEEYTFSLPMLLLTDPLSKECLFDFDGRLMVRCVATGLETVVKFKPWMEHAVKGYVMKRRTSNTDAATDNDTNRVAKIEGTFSGQVLAEGIEVDASGILFDASDFQPPLPYPLAINLAEPGPRATTRLWSSMLEAVLYTDIQQAEKVGKKAGEMVAALPGFMKKSLMYEVPEGPKPAGGGGGSQLQGDGSGLLLEAGGKRDMRPLPPAAKGQRAQGRSLGYQLLYAVKAVPPAVADDGL